MLALRQELLRISKNPGWQISFLFIVVFISRLPFIDAGYGVNVDAWRVARVARDIAKSGEYSVSRFPGYPLQEIVYSWFWTGGAVTLNMLTALLSATAAAAFAALARKLQCRYWWLSALALAATPIFFVSSVCSKDYIWAISFVLLSLLASLHRKPITAGLLLGLATGCRITSLAMLLPIGLIFFGQHSGRELRILFRFTCSAVLTAVLVFSLVWLHYGTRFFTFYDNHARPDWITIARRGTVEIWGSIGLVALAIALGAVILKREKILPAKKWLVTALLCALAIYLAAYLRLPDQAGYLLPIVPCVLLLLNLLTPPRIWLVVCLFLLFSPLADVSSNGFTHGAILSDHALRLSTMVSIRNFLQYSEKLPGRNTIVVGAWEPQIAVLAPNLANGKNHYAYMLNASEVMACLKRRECICYIPSIREFDYWFTGVDLARFGAHDLHELFVSGQTERKSRQ